MGPSSERVMLMEFFWLQSHYFSMLRAFEANCGEPYWKTPKTALWHTFQKRRHKFLTKQCFLHQDSSQVHTTKAAVLSLAYACGTPVKHPAYCPDLTPLLYLIVSYECWNWSLTSDASRHCSPVHCGKTACSIVFRKMVEHCKNMTLLGIGHYAKASDAWDTE
jgi:hypothetical protein